MVRKLLEDGEGLVGAAFRNVMGGDITGGAMSGGGMSGGAMSVGAMSGKGSITSGGSPHSAAVNDGRAPSMSRMQRQPTHKINTNTFLYTNTQSYTISPLFRRMLPSKTF